MEYFDISGNHWICEVNMYILFYELNNHLLLFWNLVFFSAGAIIELIVDKEKFITGFFFQTHEMQKIFDVYPEVLLIDATYKLINLGMPVFVLMVIDGNGNML